METATQHTTGWHRFWSALWPGKTAVSAPDGGHTEARSAGTLKSSSWWERYFNIGSNTSPNVTTDSSQSIPALFRAWSLIAEQIASLPISVYERSDDTIQEAKDHPLYRLIKFRPHPLYNSFDFRQAIVRMLLLCGTCCLQIVRNASGQVQELRMIGKPLDVYQMGTNWYYRFSGMSAPLRSDEVIHLKGWTVDGINGQDVLSLFKSVLGRALSEIEVGEKYFAGGAHLSGILISERPMSPEQRKQLQDSWGRENEGRDRIGKTGVVPFGVKYQQLGQSMKDSQFVENHAITTEDVSNITGVSPTLLGKTDSPYANIEEQNRAFVQYTLRSWCRLIEAELNTKLFEPEQWGQFFIEFNLNGLLQGDSRARAELYQALYNIRAINPNEIRKMENWNPYEGGDEFGMPLASNTKEAVDNEA